MTTTPQAGPDPRSPARTTPRPASRWLPLAAVAFTLLAWASAFVGIRHLGESVPPGSLALGRLVVATLALGVLLVASRRVRLPPRGAWPLLVAGGVGWIGVYNVALNAGEQRIDAGTAALVVQVGPVVVAALATLVLGERTTRWLYAGLAVGFAGVVLIGRASSQGPTGDLVGVLLVLVAAVGFAVGVLTQKKLLGDLSALEVTFWFYVVGTVTCLPWTLELVDVVGRTSAADLGWWLYLGVVPSALAFLTWAYALSSSDAGSFAMTTFLVPFVTALLAWLTLGEVPPAMAFVGGALCIAGVLLTRRRPRAPEPAPEPGSAQEG
ncbi:DMT family transporter [Nocardioides lentus]|uniref:DMT family transporter n=1 Tax=Nocardioides lentus TaxID=338077 RepID=A0ABN2PAC6_9ACTN